MAATFPQSTAPQGFPVRVGSDWVLAFLPSENELRVYGHGETISSDSGETLTPDNPSLATYGVEAEHLQTLIDSNG